MSDNTQLINYKSYNPKKQLIFSAPESGSVPDSKPKIEFKRIMLSSRNEDGTVGKLVMPTERLFSFGLSPNINEQTGAVTGYTLPLCLWNRENPSADEKIWVNTFDAIVNQCIDHLVDIREEIDQETLTREQLCALKGGLNPLYWKKEKITDENGKVKTVKVTDQGPTLYAKLLYSKKDNKIKTQIYDAITDQVMDPLDLQGKYCYATSVIRFESIFIGGSGKISLQLKLYEAQVELVQNNSRRLLPRPPAISQVTLDSANKFKSLNDIDGDGDELEETNSLDDEPPTPAPKVVNNTNSTKRLGGGKKVTK